MKTIVDPPGSVPLKLWTEGVPVEPEALAQLKRLAALPFVTPHIAVMPDVHVGKGATVGSVVATSGAIVPAAVGVDIGCGMRAVRTSLTSGDLPDSLASMRDALESAIPHGRTHDGGPNDKGRWGEVPEDVAEVWQDLADGWRGIVDRHPKVHGRTGVTAEHLGTLGTGNHFVEVCLDEDDRVWVMLHSGSRGVGNRIGSYFIERAKEEMRRWFISLPDADLAYLPEGSSLFDDYVDAVGWAQSYASANRDVMMVRALRAMRHELGRKFEVSEEAVDCHHNYIEQETHFKRKLWVTRKGAVSARQGRMGIIPGSMGTRSYIVRGKGNKESFCSCSHGAGRRMSRGDAQRSFTLADHRTATEGVECRKDRDVLDETPGAYKDIDAVMAAQVDLVDVVHTLKQILCVKG